MSLLGDSYESGVPFNATTLDFLSATPPTLTSYTRATTNEFYRNSSGKMVNASSNEVRLDHTFAGVPLGIRYDPVSTNKCTNYNWNMTDLTGLTVGGNASASVTISTHPVHGHPVILIDNTLGGSGSAYVTVAGTVGNTNPHSMQACARALVGLTSGTFITDSGGSNTKNLVDAGVSAVNTDGLIRSENWTPSNTSRSMRMSVAIGCKGMFWLNQLEELEVCTFPLLVAGATATRTAAASYHNLSAIPTYNETEGSIIVEAMFDRISNVASQYLVQVANGTSTANTHGLYANSTTYGQIRGRTAIGSTSYTGNDVHCPIRGKRFPAATAWRNNRCFVAAGPMTFEEFDHSAGIPTGMNRINIGGRGTSDPLCGWVRKIHVLDKYVEEGDLATYMFPADGTVYRGIMDGGQSNAHGMHRSTETKQNGGEVEAVVQMDAVYTTSENWFLRGAKDGSAADKANDGASGYINWWYDRATGQFGPRMTYFKRVANAFGIANLVKIVPWDQGASDAADSLANFKLSTLAIFNEFVSFLGAGTKILIRPISRRSDGAFDSTYGMVKRAQRQLVDENPSYIYETPPQDNITTGTDGIHLSNSSYAYTAKNTIRKALSIMGETVSGPVDPPRFSTISAAGATVTIPVSFPSGITAISPTSGIVGFRAFDGDPQQGGTEITINSATYSTGNITLTLATLPTGDLFIEYARGGLYTEYLAGGSVNPVANLAVGNDSNTLGLAWNVSYVTARRSLQGAGFANVVAQYSATIARSYNGSGSTLFNIIDTPADGSSKSAYDLTLSGLTFNGSPDSPAAYFSSVGAGYAQIAANTPFLRDLHKTGGSDYCMIMAYEPGATSNGSLVSTHTGASAAGMEIQTSTSITHRQANGTTSSPVSGGTIATGDTYLLIIGHDNDANMSVRAINSRTGTYQTHTFLTTSTDANGLFTLFGRTAAANLMPSGSKLKEFALLNTYPNDTLIASLVDYYNTLNGDTYA